MRGACPECGFKNRVAASICLWCYDLALLAGGFIPDGLHDRWNDEELTLLKSRAASRRSRLLREQGVRREARRRLRTEDQLVRDGQEVLV